MAGEPERGWLQTAAVHQPAKGVIRTAAEQNTARARPSDYRPNVVDQWHDVTATGSDMHGAVHAVAGNELSSGGTGTGCANLDECRPSPDALQVCASAVQDCQPAQRVVGSGSHGAAIDRFPKPAQNVISEGPDAVAQEVAVPVVDGRECVHLVVMVTRRGHVRYGCYGTVGLRVVVVLRRLPAASSAYSKRCCTGPAVTAVDCASVSMALCFTTAPKPGSLIAGASARTPSGAEGWSSARCRRPSASYSKARSLSVRPSSSR